MESKIMPEAKVMQCEAHDLLISELERVKNNESQLYELDRKRQTQLADIQSSISEIKVKNQNMENDIQELKTDMSHVKTDMSEVKTDVSEVKAVVTNLDATVNEINKRAASKRWQPQDYVAIIVAALALAGTIVTALLK